MPKFFPLHPSLSDFLHKYAIAYQILICYLYIYNKV